MKIIVFYVPTQEKLYEKEFSTNNLNDPKVIDWFQDNIDSIAMANNVPSELCLMTTEDGFYGWDDNDPEDFELEILREWNTGES